MQICSQTPLKMFAKDEEKEHFAAQAWEISQYSINMHEGDRRNCLRVIPLNQALDLTERLEHSCNSTAALLSCDINNDININAKGTLNKLKHPPLRKRQAYNVGEAFK